MRWATMTAALLVLSAIVAGIAMFSHNRLRSTLAATEKSIAVLPFENRSEDKANAYFADGIQDEILTRLAKIGALKVISRTSTQQYGTRPGNPSEIARQLNVANILEGSVQKAGDQVHINAQLIRAATGERWREASALDGGEGTVVVHGLDQGSRHRGGGQSVLGGGQR